MKLPKTARGTVLTTIGKILVTGAAGSLGRLVVQALLRSGGGVVAASRTPSKLGDASFEGAELRTIDFDDSDTLEPAFAGIERALVISTDELTAPGHRKRQHRSALSAAVAAGVTHVAYTSMPDPQDSAAIPFASDHAAMEEAILDSGLDYTILRNGWYQENLLGYLPQILADGTWYTAAGEGRIPFVSREDTAEATAALLRTADGRGVFDIAGPQALTIEEIAGVASDVLDRPLRVEHVDEARAFAELTRQGVPASMVPMAVVTDANQRARKFEVGPGAVPGLIGRPLRTIAEFFDQHRADLLAHATG